MSINFNNNKSSKLDTLKMAYKNADDGANVFLKSKNFESFFGTIGESIILSN